MKANELHMLGSYQIESFSFFSQQPGLPSTDSPHEKTDLVLENLSSMDLREGNEDQNVSQGHNNDLTEQPTESVMKQTTVGFKHGSARLSIDDKQAFSNSVTINEPELSIKQNEVIHMRPCAAYSRHFVDEYRQNEFTSGKQGRRPVFDTEWPAHPINIRSGRNNSLLLASGTEDLWQSSRRISSPGVGDDSASEFSSGHSTPVAGHSGTR